MELRLHKFGEEILEQKTKPVSSFDADLKAKAQKMYDIMVEYEGLGLAGPQAGLDISIFVIDMRCRRDKDEKIFFSLDSKELPLDLSMPLFAVNPKVTEIGEFVVTSEEGCLSFPAIYVEKTRSEQVQLDYFDLEGVPHTIICDGLFARCIQHEYDHLQGLCIIDNIHPRARNKIEAKLKKLKRETKQAKKSIK
ncbi:MAG: peptide deformylase [Opitutales bacterium]